MTGLGYEEKFDQALDVVRFVVLNGLSMTYPRLVSQRNA